MADSHKSTLAFPSRLSKEPLIDAVFEIRLVAPDGMSSILPGILHGILEGEKTFEAMPTTQIPKEIRDQDPSLMYVPLVKMGWKDHWIFIGDRMISIACKLPYPGWHTFKASIDRIINIAAAHSMITSVSRYSLKYVNIFDTKSLSPSQTFKVEIKIGENYLQKNPFQVRTETTTAGITSTIQIVSDAEVMVLDQAPKDGAILDIDSSANVSNESPDAFYNQLKDRLEKIKTANRTAFYECISEQALKELGPIYE